MPRRTMLDTYEGRLPAGLQRVGQDFDNKVYTFRAADSTLWEFLIADRRLINYADDEAKDEAARRDAMQSVVRHWGRDIATWS
ncbi:hypothetical protein FPOA_03348 [Fusarium poae]|uniref:Uncharacterized protein n=1 Tax=Fusarium poae TaxID=36050 RepID=A0A1B8B9K8_FUSPO|nr:hypothetical protein FPOA_03348 [Fusarium poae]